MPLQFYINRFFQENCSVFSDGKVLNEIFANGLSVRLDVPQLQSYFRCFAELNFQNVQFAEVQCSFNAQLETMLLLVHIFYYNSGQTVAIPLTDKEKQRLWDLYVDIKTGRNRA